LNFNKQRRKFHNRKRKDTENVNTNSYEKILQSVNTRNEKKNQKSKLQIEIALSQFYHLCNIFTQ